MKRKWRVTRTLEEKSDGQLRWDYAYQLLLQWTQQRENHSDSPTCQLENSDENCTLCPCIDRTSTANDDN